MKTGPSLILLVVLFPLAVFADEGIKIEEKTCNRTGLNVWGFSHHIQRRNNQGDEYEELNLGLGWRCYPTKKPEWMEGKEDLGFFFEVDAMRNSYRGLLVALTTGVEQEAAVFRSGCKISVVGVVTLAYYEDRINKETHIMFGPAPGISFGCDRVMFNLVLIPKTSENFLRVVAGSATVLGPENKSLNGAGGKFYQLAVGNDQVGIQMGYRF